MRLKDKVAIITGASKGIGRAIALGFAREGADTTLAARSGDLLEQVAEEIRQIGRQGLPVVTDVTDEAAVENMVARTMEEFGRLDILVNNAGISATRPVWGIKLEDWERMMAINLRGPFLCTKHAWRVMRKQGGGVIVNVGSLAGTRAYPMVAAYSASKWGLVGLTKACAEEGKRGGIRVNIMCPGKVDTDMRAHVTEDKSQMMMVEDCVGTAVYLACDESQYVNGQVIELEWA